MAGCHLLNQSVLLKGINDNAQILAQLSQALFAYGVIPYYLHVLDKVQGAAHFDISTQDALDIYHRLQELFTTDYKSFYPVIFCQNWHVKNPVNGVKH